MQSWKRFVILVSSVCVFALFSFVPVLADDSSWFDHFLEATGFSLSPSISGSLSGSTLSPVSGTTLGLTGNVGSSFINGSHNSSSFSFTDPSRSLSLYSSSLPSFSDPARTISLSISHSNVWTGKSNERVFHLSHPLSSDVYLVFGYITFFVDVYTSSDGSSWDMHSFGTINYNDQNNPRAELRGFLLKSGTRYFKLSSYGYYCSFYVPYFGSLQDMPSDLSLLFGLKKYDLADIHNDIVSGNSASQSVKDSINSKNTDLSNNISSVNTFENQQGQNFTNDMQSINFESSDLVENSSFLSSAKFVRDQYEHLTNDTPFYSLIVFSLSLGIGLTVIGRLRNR